jgi:hypothetical protein
MGTIETEDRTRIFFKDRGQPDVTARRAVKMIEGATLKVYPRGDHGICVTRKDEVNADLLAFCRA